MKKYDYYYFNEELKRRGRTKAWLANKLGIDKYSLRNKFAGYRSFSQDDIYKISKIMQLTPKQVYQFFFTPYEVVWSAKEGYNPKYVDITGDTKETETIEEVEEVDEVNDTPIAYVDYDEEEDEDIEEMITNFVNKDK